VQQVSQLKGEIDRSQLDYRVYKTNPVVMEKQAREELNLVKTGEIVYKFSGSGD
jgi:cell division protein FtsB